MTNSDAEDPHDNGSVRLHVVVCCLPRPWYCPTRPEMHSSMATTDIELYLADPNPNPNPNT